MLKNGWSGVRDWMKTVYSLVRLKKHKPAMKPRIQTHPAATVGLREGDRGPVEKGYGKL